MEKNESSTCDRCKTSIVTYNPLKFEGYGFCQPCFDEYQHEYGIAMQKAQDKFIEKFMKKKIETKGSFSFWI
jgi:S-methylmethionine-dependent homocysteine/selenocysteine methylase